MSQDKRAILFEYFQSVGLPKWVRTDGARLHKTLRGLTDEKIDAMHAQMLEQKARQQKPREQKETVMYKRWQSPLFFLLVWGGFAIFIAISPKPPLAICMMYSFIAGSYFEELFTNLIHNYIEKKFSKTGSKK